MSAKPPKPRTGVPLPLTMVRSLIFRPPLAFVSFGVSDVVAGVLGGV